MARRRVERRQSDLANRRDILCKLVEGNWWILFAPEGVQECPADDILKAAWNEVGDDLIAAAKPGEKVWALEKFGKPHNDTLV